MKRLPTTLSVLVLAISAATGLAIGTRQSAAAQQSSCLHGQDETADQANRRRQALQTAREINTSEANLFRTGNAYPALANLRISNPPDGFVVNLAADVNGYVFAVKDQRDACRFAFFSDQDGVIYTAQPIR